MKATSNDEVVSGIFESFGVGIQIFLLILQVDKCGSENKLLVIDRWSRLVPGGGP